MTERSNTPIVVLGTPHRLREPGKQSPDARLSECIYGRQMAVMVRQMLEERGITAVIDYEPTDLPVAMQCSNVSEERLHELNMRVNIVNTICRQHHGHHVVYVSIHVNAAASDRQWHTAHGWQVCVGTRAGSQSKLLADSMAAAAMSNGLHVRQPLPTQHYWPMALHVLNHTLCPAVLTENLFQDNMQDVDFLLSAEGRRTIARVHADGIINYLQGIFFDSRKRSSDSSISSRAIT